MSDCLFCRIVAGEVPCYKIYEDDNYLAFLDISQITDGHTLLIPKLHVKYVWDIVDVGGYFSAAQKIARHFQEVSGSKSVISVTIGEMVAHAHMHLVPDSEGSRDKVVQGWNEAREARRMSDDEMKKIRTEYNVNS